MFKRIASGEYAKRLNEIKAKKKMRKEMKFAVSLLLPILITYAAFIAIGAVAYLMIVGWIK